MRTVNNRTFIHGDCQWLPSTLSGPYGEQGRQASLLRGRFTWANHSSTEIRLRALRRHFRQLSSRTICLTRLYGRCGLAHGTAAIGAGPGTATRRLLDLGADPLVAIEPIPQQDRPPILDASPQIRKERTFDALIARLRSLGRVNTLLVVLEDTHWADHQDRENGSLPRR